MFLSECEVRGRHKWARSESAFKPIIYKLMQKYKNIVKLAVVPLIMTTSLIDLHSADSFSRDTNKMLRSNNGLYRCCCRYAARYGQ